MRYCQTVCTVIEQNMMHDLNLNKLKQNYIIFNKTSCKISYINKKIKWTFVLLHTFVNFQNVN